MKIILRTLAAASAAVLLTACALMGPPSQDRLRDTQAAIVVWTDFVQPAIITYGSLPDCDAAKPLVKICKNHALWATKIQPTAWAAHEAIQAAAPVIIGEVLDTGQIAKAWDAIKAAETAWTSKPAPPAPALQGS